MQTVWAALIFLFSSGYVLVLDYFAFSSRGLQKSLVLPLFIFLFIIYRSSVSSWKTFITQQGKWFLLLWGTILVQTLVIATGGLQSPFLILLHLSMIAISFFVTFTAAFVFLLFSFIVILVDISFNHNVLAFFITNPSTIILQIVSLFSIIPLAYIISQQYHVKELLSTMLREKVTTDEAILESLKELIIVTDPQLNILSVNDATEQTLQKSRSELVSKPLFRVLLMKNKKGTIATKKLFFPDGNTSKEPRKLLDEFTIINAPALRNTVTIQTQVIKNAQAQISQISFVLNFAETLPTQADSLVIGIEKARTKYEAMSENFKKQLLNANLPEVQSQMVLLEKIENDIYNAHALTVSPVRTQQSRIDIAKLGEQLVSLQQNFAKSLNVQINFAINNFGQKDIEPLTVKNYPVKPHELTGPFFTVPCDVKQTEILIKKLLDLSVFLAAGNTNPKVKFEIDREGTDSVTVTVSGPCPTMSEENRAKLFIPNYGKLYPVTSLHAGSGLEGYLIKTITDRLGVPLEMHYEAEPEAHITFKLIMMKAVAEASGQGR